ncbi:MAG: tRNA (cytidine(56)-2'-O)-methyltransferase [Thermoprotei archaeon]|nr:MAG: tRNA (cytidine(56)-2'-O)-methyltransferase [Thermoprotei archaeon]RLE98808.1 MAG: tRNA (cytidine(56)-2'-O)-methyltransferase [Thermoprotei archaeon]
MKVVVLRYGHRPKRDKRVSTHVALVARAFGASGIIFSDTVDPKIKETINKVVKTWGGEFFIEMGRPWREVISTWKAQGGIVVHLTMYGENIEASDILERIKRENKDILVIVGSQKVPKEFYYIADYNVAIGNQPHSEVAALAVFLYKLFEGKCLLKEYKAAKLKIIPQKRGKRVIEVMKNVHKCSETQTTT